MGRPGGHCAARCHPVELQLEGRAPADPARNRDLAAKLIDDFARYRQAEPEAASFGGSVYAAQAAPWSTARSVRQRSDLFRSLRRAGCS